MEVDQAADEPMHEVSSWLLELHAEAYMHLRSEMDSKNADGSQKYVDVPDYLTQRWKGKEGIYAGKLAALDAECLAHTGETDTESFQKTVPQCPKSRRPTKSGGPVKYKVRLWQVGFAEEASLKGASSLSAVFDILKDCLCDQPNNTEEFPLELLFELLGQQAGEAIGDFAVGTSNGFAVVSAAHLLALCAIDLGWLNDRLDQWTRGPVALRSGLTPAQMAALLAQRLLKVLRLTCTYQPAESVAQQVSLTFKRKMAAANRRRPNCLQLLYGFSRAADALQRAGTRKGPAAIMQAVLAQHNAEEAVAGRRIANEEISGVLFLMGTSDEFRREVKLAWGHDTPVNTALPMNLLNSSFLRTETPLPMNTKGTTWAAILTPTEAKRITWVQRVRGAWGAKIELVEAKMRQADTKHNARLYRDKDAETVWRMSCMMEEGREYMSKVLTAEQLHETWRSFNRGALDSQLISEAMSMRREYKFSDMPFLRTQAACAEILEDQSTSVTRAVEAQVQAEFQLFQETLKAEVMVWHRFQTDTAVYESETLAEITAHRERLHDAYEAAAHDQISAHYATAGFPDLTTAEVFLVGEVRRLADQHPSVPTSQVLRIDFVNLPMLGANCSLRWPDITQRLRVQAAAAPETWCCVMMAPNQPAYRKTGNPTGHALQVLIEQFRKTCLESLRIGDTLFVVACTAHFDEANFYSDSRAAVQHVWLVISGQEDQEGALKSRFAKSNLFRRETVPGTVEALPRDQFQNWSDLDSAFDRGNLDAGREKRQWSSGVSLLSSTLRALLKGLKPTGKALIQDLTLYDNQLALAIMGMNAEGSKLPVMNYAGVCWQPKACDAIAEAVRESLHQVIMQGLRTKTHHLSAGQLRALGPEPTRGSKPVLKQDVFFVTCPRANQELPVRQEHYDRWTKTSYKDEFANVIQKHDAAYNPSGVPWKTKRPSDAPLHEQPEKPEEPAPIAPVHRDGDPSTIDELENGTYKEIALDKSSGKCLLLQQDGRLWISGSEDVTVSEKDCIFQLRGKYKKAGAADKTRTTGTAWVEYKLDAGSMVAVDFKTPLPDAAPFSTGPVTLESLLNYLEANGHVRVSLHLHKAAKAEGGGWQVTTDEGAVLDVGVKESEDADFATVKISISKISSWLDISKLKQSAAAHIVHRLSFDPATNKLTAGWPGVYLRQRTALAKGSLLRLA